MKINSILSLALSILFFVFASNCTHKTKIYQFFNDQQKLCLGLKADFGDSKEKVLANWKNLRKDHEFTGEQYEVYFSIHIGQEDLSRVDYLFFEDNRFAKLVSAYAYDSHLPQEGKNVLNHKKTCVQKLLKPTQFTLTDNTLSAFRGFSLEVNGVVR